MLLCALGLALPVLAIVPAAPAQAADFPTYGSGVRVRADATTASAVVTTLAPGETIGVDCQKRGERVVLDGADSEWWAHVPSKGGYVTVAYVDVPESQLPGVPVCGGTDPEPVGAITYADLVAMFPGKVADQATVETGLPSLNAEMVAAGITTAPRQAAFLATLANESTFRYNAVQAGGATYTGRGYIQLTGDFNYSDAGDYLGIDLLGNPGLASSLDHSAPIARWYWTVARDINPLADALDMGAVDDAIGYATDPDEDVERCDDFKAALAYLTGSVPSGVNCVRPARGGGTGFTRDQSREQFADEMRELKRVARTR
ncbi:hypothetical protein GCM10023340_40640 [Nocardioides marinquilinus]|uniref:Glycoside hydrolase family 19 catalytic domain-containing protein n=2 Tax=Nocardioides marinquilinus TaxID=1210400 RepID=A0ABP9Q1T6_9ACTN